MNCISAFSWSAGVPFNAMMFLKTCSAVFTSAAGACAGAGLCARAGVVATDAVTKAAANNMISL